MRALLAGAMLLIGAAEATAGAWPREPGTAFLSVSQRFTTGPMDLRAPLADLESYTSIFAEYGLSESWTVGLDAGHGRGDFPVTTALAFARHPVWQSEGGQIVSAELGLGWRDHVLDGSEARLRPGLSWGRGFESRWGAGWLGVDATAEWRLPSADLVLKADFTAGIRPTERTMLIAQLQTARFPDADPAVRLAPSVVRRFGARTHLQLGLDAGLAGEDTYGIKLATWWTF